MAILQALNPAPDDAVEGELIYVVGPGGPGRRSFGSVWRNVLGRSAASARGFFGATPVAQPSGAAQAAAPGAPISATAGATYTAGEQQLINDLKAQVNALTTLCNAQRAALVSLGLIKGGA